MVLLLTYALDSTVPMVEAELNRQGHEFLRLNTETFGTDFGLEFTGNYGDSGMHFLTARKEVNGAAIQSIWNRRPFPPIPKPQLADPAGCVFAAAELKASLDGALLSLDSFWMSHPQAVRTAGHKLTQLRAATRLGLAIPATCVTAEPERIRAFAQHLKSTGRRISAKIVSKGPPRAPTPSEQYEVFTQVLSDADLVDDTALAACPAIYQEYIEKQFELRVTVVGRQVFACEIHSQATERTRTDWRRYDLPNTPHRVHTLDSRVEAQCLALTEGFGLVFAAIDLIIKPDGTVVFLELNPNGQWGWIEELTGLPIAAAIAGLLGKGGQ